MTMRSIQRVLAVTGLLIVFATGTVNAAAPTALHGFGHRGPATILSNCNTGQVRLWEDASYGGSSLIVCYGDNISNLGNVVASAGCDGGILIYGDWHDCISSFKVTNADCHIKLQVFVDAGYGSAMPGPYSGTGNRIISSMGSYNDTMSSLQWTYLATCPM